MGVGERERGWRASHRRRDGSMESSSSEQNLSSIFSELAHALSKIEQNSAPNQFLFFFCFFRFFGNCKENCWNYIRLRCIKSIASKEQGGKYSSIGSCHPLIHISSHNMFIYLSIYLSIYIYIKFFGKYCTIFCINCFNSLLTSILIVVVVVRKFPISNDKCSLR